MVYRCRIFKLGGSIGPWYTLNTNTGSNLNGDSNKWKGKSSDKQDYLDDLDWTSVDFDDSKWASTRASGNADTVCAAYAESGQSLAICNPEKPWRDTLVASYWCQDATVCQQKKTALSRICPDDSEGTGNFKGNHDASNPTKVYWAFRHHI